LAYKTKAREYFRKFKSPNIVYASSIRDIAHY